MQDFMLVTLITLSEQDPPMEHDVTLLVGGFLVSGFVISYKKWIEHHHTLQAINYAIEQYNSNLPKTPDNTRNYIHLRNAKYYLPGSQPIPHNMSVYIRIPLESIQGFSFGKLEAQNNY